MTIASIDIGSNTIILLIAKYDAQSHCLSSIHNGYHIPRISEGLVWGGEITDSAIKRLLINLEDFYRSIYNNHVDVVLVNATNAMRIATNADIIKKQIEHRFNWDVNIISGEREAELTFLGIVSPFTKSDDNNIIILDIGGGSTEVSFGKNNKIAFRKSYNLGIVSLFHQFIRHNPPTEEELISIKESIRKTFREFKETPFPEYAKTIAVAGTPTTIASIMVNARSYEDELIENVEITQNYLTNFITSITGLQSSQILEKYGNLVNGREDLILIGSVILEEFMKINEINSVIVSSKGLRYGAILDYLVKNKNLS